jgi:hypothetical protein
MKLAEALSIRADLQKKISQLRERLGESAKVQEGDQPIEDCAILLVELDESLKALNVLINQINYTNMMITVPGENMTVAELIAKKDVLSIKISVLQEVTKYAADNYRHGSNEIRYVRTIDVAAFRKTTDELSKELRKLDMKLQSLNWTVDLICK